jgi:hypothetical protein
MRICNIEDRGGLGNMRVKSSFNCLLGFCKSLLSAVHMNFGLGYSFVYIG